jgi:hypothetical protein
MTLQDRLREALSRFQTSFSAVKATLSNNLVFHDMALAQARSAFCDRMCQIFTADFEPVAKSSETVNERLLLLISGFEQQRAAYLAAFLSEVDQNAAQRESVKALQQSFQNLLA